MTTKDLLNLNPYDINKMTEQELRKAVSQMASTANKALKRMQLSGKVGQSIKAKNVLKRDYTTEQGGKFGVKGKNLNQLRNEYTAIKGYLTSKTGTLTGLNKQEKKIVEKMGRGFRDAKEAGAFWDTIHKIKEMYPSEYSKELVDIALEINGGQQSDEEVLFDINDKTLGDTMEEIIDFLYNNQGIDIAEDDYSDREALIYDLSSKGMLFDVSGNLHTISDVQEELFEVLSVKVEASYNEKQQKYNATAGDIFSTISGSGND